MAATRARRMASSASSATPSLRPKRPASRRLREQRYFNRELSWLAFNRRVLEEACNGHHPLLERLRFLSISASNLDEFFMVRVAGPEGAPGAGGRGALCRRHDHGASNLTAIEEEADRLVDSQEEVWREPSRRACRAGDVIVVGDEAARREGGRLARPPFPRADLPAADAAGDRPGAPLPVHPEQGLFAHFRAEARQAAHPRAAHASGRGPALHPHPRRSSRATSRWRR